VAGREYEVDCIVWATGFEVGTDFVSRCGFDLIGRDGLRLSEHWADGMRTLHGIHVHGFPNAFIVQLSQGANHIANVPHNMSEAGATIAAVVGAAVERGCRTVEATAEAEEAWLQRLHAGSPTRLLGGGDGDAGGDGEGGAGRSLYVPGSAECTPGYYNNEGQPATAAQRANVLGFPGGPLAFFSYIDAWRSTGDFAGLEMA